MEVPIGFAIIIASIVGYSADKKIQNKYFDSAIHGVSFLLQSVCIFALYLTIVSSAIIGVIISIVATFFSYRYAMTNCKARAISLGMDDSDIKTALIAQFLLPIGLVFAILAISALFSGTGRRRKK